MCCVFEANQAFNSTDYFIVVVMLVMLYFVVGRIVFLVCDPAVEINGFQYILYAVFWPVIWMAVIVWKLSQKKFWVDLYSGMLVKAWQAWEWLIVKKGGW